MNGVPETPLGYVLGRHAIVLASFDDWREVELELPGSPARYHMTLFYSGELEAAGPLPAHVQWTLRICCSVHGPVDQLARQL